MGTRSLTAFYEGERPLAVLYRQMDGYPTGQGLDLCTVLKGGRMINGIGAGDNSRSFNGAGDLAVRTITALKGDASEPGQFYLVSPFDAFSEGGWEEYRYHVLPSAEGSEINLRVESGYGKNWTTIYDGPIDEFDPEAVERDEAS